MVLLDRERQAAKEVTAQLTRQLADMSEKAQTHREKAIELEANIRQLTEQNNRLESDLDQKTAKRSELSAALAQQQAHALLMQREFEAYKEAHKISGDLGALQIAVATLQAKMEEKRDG